MSLIDWLSGATTPALAGFEEKLNEALHPRRKNVKGEKKHENRAQNNRNRKTRRLDY